mmetsp:Transcript_11750/g.30499  ORF Transcript_11750/g.30499 Transcript_11750/m.30499 type:complete len:626 (-) Transcript_11750:153-2030(-)|eukprot:CAMPEP_0174934408 /NCGR_PEP_ID=MMETSP1355-20121228/49434_1 /TAXON_ID=464990 /ORGANISM="Hemiselmis tepida, Strain CCMP443" /LENGTH=625 /DNA_ID=CAMNT_0016181005 /DNA_START=22 /DNA_END=1899 /DNA_ORIENTATION=+
MSGYGDQQQLYEQPGTYQQPQTWQQPQYVPLQQPQSVGPYGQDGYRTTQYTNDPYIPYDQGPPTVTVQQPQQIPPPQPTVSMTQFIERPPQTVGSVTKDINGPQGTVMTSTWILPQEAPAWVSKASSDWKSARSCFICSLLMTFLVVLLGVIYITVLIWQNPQRLEIGLDLHKLTLAYENARYYDEVAVHNARMCALTGDADFGTAYKNAQAPFLAAVAEYVGERTNVQDNAIYQQVATAKAQMATVETQAVNVCTRDGLVQFSENWTPVDSTGVSNLLGSRYSTNHGALLKGFGVVAADLQKVEEFRRGDNWWARYNLAICFAVTGTCVGVFLAFLAGAGANLTRAMYMWDEGAPRMLPRQCQGAGACWTDNERKSAIACARQHPFVVFSSFLVFTFFAVIIFYMEFNAQEAIATHDEIILMHRNVLETRYLDEALTETTRLCALTGNRQWKDRYHEMAPKMDAAIDAIMISQEHLTGRVGLSQEITWDENKDRIEKMRAAHAALTQKRENLMSVCADEVVLAQADGIGNSNRAVAFGQEYMDQKNIFMEHNLNLLIDVQSGWDQIMESDWSKLRDGFRGASITFCVLMFFIAVAFVWFMLVVTRNQYESKVPASFKEVGLSSF